LGVFTLPFEFEGKKKMETARDSLEKMKPNLNAFVIIPNQKIFEVIDKKTPLRKAFSAINGSLAESLTGLVEMIYTSGMINVDFADLKTTLQGKGKLAYLSTAELKPQNQIEDLLRNVLTNPLYPYSPHQASSILFNIDGGLNLSMSEVDQAGKTIADFVHARPKISFGITLGEKDKVKITLLANGCKWEKWEKEEERPKKKPKRKPEEQEPFSKIKEETKKSELKMKGQKLKRKPRKKRRPKIKVELNVPNEIKKKETILSTKETLQSAKEGEVLDENYLDIPAFLRRKPRKTQETPKE